MTRKCTGCGTVLQNTDDQAPGYVPDLNMAYCQRCFRMIHYDRHDSVEVEPLKQLDHLKNLEGDFCWIMDVIDLETSLNSQFAEFYRNREVLVILNKCDLLPETVKEDRIISYVRERLIQLSVKCRGIITRGFSHHFREDFSECCRPDRKTYFTGVANVGKSTVINHLLKENRLTANRHPSTTLNTNEIETDYGIICDTVGLVADNSVQAYLKSSDLKKAVPSKPINPVIFQLDGNQTVSIGGICRMDFYNCHDFTAVFYISNECPLHRTKTSNATSLWNGHLGRELVPVLTVNKGFKNMKKKTFRPKEGKQDICIAGLGWVCISGGFDRCVAFTDTPVDTYSRKAMI